MKILSKCAGVISLLLIAWLTPPALAAYGPVELHAGRGLRASRSERFSFVLPVSWRRGPGSQESPKWISTYERQVDLGQGASCTLSIYARAVPQRQSPKVSGSALTGFSGIGGITQLRIRIRGRSASTRWFVGSGVGLSGAGVGVAVSRTSPWVASRQLRWTVVGLTVTRNLERLGPPTNDGFPVLQPTRRQMQRCGKIEVTSMRTVLRTALGSVQFQHGSPYAVSNNG